MPPTLGATLIGTLLGLACASSGRDWSPEPTPEFLAERPQRIAVRAPSDDGDPVDLDFVPPDPVHLPAPVTAILAADGASILVADGVANVIQRYGFDGGFLGTFAPAGGANVAILQEPAGMTLAPNGDLLVAVRSGPNAHTIARFDRSGAYLGNFVATSAGGLMKPIDVERLPSGGVFARQTGPAEESEPNRDGEANCQKQGASQQMPTVRNHGRFPPHQQGTRTPKPAHSGADDATQPRRSCQPASS